MDYNNIRLVGHIFSPSMTNIIISSVQKHSIIQCVIVFCNCSLYKQNKILLHATISMAKDDLFKFLFYHWVFIVAYVAYDCFH